MTSADASTILELEDPDFPSYKISDYQFREFHQTNGSETDTIADKLVTFNIPADQQILLYVLSDGYILIEGQFLVQLPGNVDYLPPNRNLAAGLVNNAGAWMFNSMKVRLGAEEVESVQQNIGTVSTIIGLLCYHSEYSRTEGGATGWKKDEASSFEDMYTVANAATTKSRLFPYLIPNAFTASNSSIDLFVEEVLADNVGTFSISLPLSRISGFCADMNKIIYNTQFTLKLSRVNGNDCTAIMTAVSGTAADNNVNVIQSRTTANAAGNGARNAYKISMSKMRLVAPCVIPKMSIQKSLSEITSERSKKL